jgi:hypothetical protein
VYLAGVVPGTLIACVLAPVWAIAPIALVGLVGGAVVCIRNDSE